PCIDARLLVAEFFRQACISLAMLRRNLRSRPSGGLPTDPPRFEKHDFEPCAREPMSAVEADDSAAHDRDIDREVLGKRGIILARHTVEPEGIALVHTSLLRVKPSSASAGCPPAKTSLEAPSISRRLMASAAPQTTWTASMSKFRSAGCLVAGFRMESAGIQPR